VPSRRRSVPPNPPGVQEGAPPPSPGRGVPGIVASSVLGSANYLDRLARLSGSVPSLPPSLRHQKLPALLRAWRPCAEGDDSAPPPPPFVSPNPIPPGLSSVRHPTRAVGRDLLPGSETGGSAAAVAIQWDSRHSITASPLCVGIRVAPRVAKLDGKGRHYDTLYSAHPSVGRGACPPQVQVCGAAQPRESPRGWIGSGAAGGGDWDQTNRPSADSYAC